MRSFSIFGILARFVDERQMLHIFYELFIFVRMKKKMNAWNVTFTIYRIFNGRRKLNIICFEFWLPYKCVFVCLEQARWMMKPRVSHGCEDGESMFGLAEIFCVPQCASVQQHSDMCVQCMVCHCFAFAVWEHWACGFRNRRWTTVAVAEHFHRAIYLPTFLYAFSKCQFQRMFMTVRILPVQQEERWETNLASNCGHVDIH